MNKDQVYFEKYKIIERIGTGGTSDVYLAENIRLGNFWAIKKAYKKENLVNLLAEPNILKNLNHPSIPKIIDIEEDEEAIYIIEEYISGKNLKEYRLEHEAIAEQDIIKWGLQICEILSYLHSRKPHPIIFRDIKPDNIIISQSDQLKLVDFGIARMYKENQSSDTDHIGTRGYAAPEQYGVGQSDDRTDIYSLGVTLYFMLTNKNLSHPPYRIQTIQQFNSKISKDLEDIILKCCETLPDKRYQNVDDLKDAFLKISLDSNTNIQLHEQQRNSVPIHPISKAPHKSITIGVIGVEKGVGVTHSSILLAKSLSKENKVALVEMNDSMDFLSIYPVEDRKKDGVVSFSFKKVDFYTNVNYEQFLYQYKDQYDYIILDFGSYEQSVDFDEFIRADLRLIIGQGIDWKVKEIERFYHSTKQYDPNANWIYLIPFLEKKYCKEIKQILNNRYFSIPFNMNPFSPTHEVKKIFFKMIQ